jgi:hypothetical protein
MDVDMCGNWLNNCAQIAVKKHGVQHLSGIVALVLASQDSHSETLLARANGRFQYTTAAIEIRSASILDMVLLGNVWVSPPFKCVFC